MESSSLILSSDVSSEDEKILPESPKRIGILHYASTLDYVLIFIGSLTSFLHGAGFPILAIVLGGMTTTFLRAQNSEFVVGINNTDPAGLPGITQDEFNENVVTYCIYYLVLGILMFVTSHLQIACWETFAERITQNLRQNYLKAILRQQIDWFDNQKTGELTARLTDDLERVREGFGDKMSLCIQFLSAFVAGFAVGFFYSWSMTLVMMIMTPFIAYSGSWMSKKMASRAQAEQEVWALAGAVAEETFSSIRTVLSLNGQRRELTRFDNALEKGRQMGLVKYFYVGIGWGLGNLCIYGSYAIAFWYGGYLVLNNPEMDRGLILTVFFAVLSGSTSFGSALPHLTTISTALGSIRFVLETLNRRPVIDPYSKKGIIINDLKGDIKLENIYFRYPSRPDITILRGVSLKVERGQKIALVGSSGCGKSTIVNLLLRFYDPESGTVKIDGVDLKEVNVNSLREQIGIVSQEPILFDGSLMENIQLGKENATEEEVREACRLANAMEFIKKLPQGFETRVGERGVQLSGGQKQRIAIARALVRNPKVLLLDEATSALDTESETIVQAALEKAMSGRTTIIVAHRLATIRNCDQIFVFRVGSKFQKTFWSYGNKHGWWASFNSHIII